MKSYLKYSVLLLLFTLMILSQRGFDLNQPRVSAEDGNRSSLSISNKVNLGLNAVLADYYYLQAIQIYGGAKPIKGYKEVAVNLKLATDLDPEFASPYAFAALILPGEGITDGYDIGKLGVERKIPDWRIPYYLAASYHIYGHDKVSAAKYFGLAADYPDAPSGLKTVASAYNSSPDDRQTAIAVWQALADGADDDFSKEKAESYLFHFQLMNFYDDAAGKYQTKFGRYPKTPADLVAGGILSSLPVDPLGVDFEFNEKGLVVIKSE